MKKGGIKASNVIITLTIQSLIQRCRQCLDQSVLAAVSGLTNNISFTIQKKSRHVGAEPCSKCDWSDLGCE